MMSSRGVALAERAPNARLALVALSTSFRLNPPLHRSIILRFLGMIKSCVGLCSVLVPEDNNSLSSHVKDYFTRNTTVNPSDI